MAEEEAKDPSKFQRVSQQRASKRNVNCWEGTVRLGRRCFSGPHMHNFMTLILMFGNQE